MHTSFMCMRFSARTHAGTRSAVTSRAALIDGVQHSDATSRRLRRRSRLAPGFSWSGLLTLLKPAVEFSSDKIAPAWVRFHVINYVAGSCLELAFTGWIEVALTRSEHER
jgi:hypothetical protein